jgi:hypothetical protein
MVDFINRSECIYFTFIALCLAYEAQTTNKWFATGRQSVVLGFNTRYYSLLK